MKFAVLGSGYGFEMVRTNTSPVFTFVVDLFALGDGSIEVAVNESMLSVAARACRSFPDPAVTKDGLFGNLA